MPSLWIVLFFVFLGLTLLAGGVGFRFLEAGRERQIGRVRKAAVLARTSPEVTILINPDPRQVPRQNGLLRYRVFQLLQDYIYTAGMEWRAEGLLAVALLLAGAGALLGQRLHVLIFQDISSLALAIVFGALPFLFVRYKRRTRLNHFEQEFPEALDFIARSVQSGHAFSVGLELLASESSEPLRSEFSRVFHELSLGADFEAAMTNLAKRVPLVDVQFFVSTVLLQKATGGNLAEMLIKLAFVIRERFQIKGHVRGASAHGRITAVVLGLMPLVLAFGLSIVSPDYLPSMVDDPFGKRLIVAAILCQCLGYYCLRKIINIKV
jgi:tight adherence protein B